MTKYLQKCLLGAAFGLALAAVYAGTAGAQAPAAPQSIPGAQGSESPQPRAARPRSNAPRRAAQPKPAGQPNYDGLWSVLIVTDSGPCDASFRYPIRITRGIVRDAQGGDAFFNISGQVGRNGGVYVAVSRGGQRADGTGRLAANGGGGSWQAAGGICSGRWTAARRG